MRMRQFSIWGLAALIGFCGCQRDVSGTYLAGDTSTVVWLQLVRTPDNHLTGQLVATVVKTDGTIDRSDVSLIGAVDGENVSLTSSGLFGLQSSTLSGTFAGDTLSLTGAQPVPIVLKRSSLSAYQVQISELNSRSQAILAAKTDALAQRNAERAQQNFVQTVGSLIDQMDRFDTEADVHLSRFPNVEKGYDAITAKMAAYVERERQLSSNPNAVVARSQLYVAVTQVSLATDQAHIQGQSLESSLEMNIKPIGNEAASIESGCQQSGNTLGALTQSEVKMRNATCSRFLAAFPQFRVKYDATKAGLAHLEEVYAREKSSQQDLLRTSEKLSH
jgi:hypothetical protein